ncbi:hypothetical protein VNI00_019082 [Paramarasmius palmivorus]|uniref:Ribonuclease H1 N-terminal domain-containing protein n=1 Tax=Paramarasmius palmivorus TaxID=297713 RepID=A0AAW0ARU0_9AGAR
MTNENIHSSEGEKLSSNFGQTNAVTAADGYTFTSHNEGSTTVRTVQTFQDWKITTVTTFERLPGINSTPNASESVTSNHAAPSVASLPGVPHPSELQLRPGMQYHTKFYVVFRGREVGIFYNWKHEARHVVEGVPHNCHRVYSTWDEALKKYAEAYYGEFPDHELAIINPENTSSDDEEVEQDDEDDSTYKAEDTDMESDSGSEGASSEGEGSSDDEMDYESESEEHPHRESSV